MSDKILPTIGSEGTYTFSAPFDSIVLPEEIYKVKGIRNISEYISYNQDVKKLVYTTYGLDDIEYENDVKEDMEIVSLQNKEGVWLYVPARYILTYPEVNGIKYRQLAIVVKLPAIEADKDLSFLVTDLGNLVKDYLGVDTVIDVIETSRTVVVTREESDQLLLDRLTIATDRLTDRARYTSLSVDYNVAMAKIQELETYIKNNI